jgi:hypothetical protein
MRLATVLGLGVLGIILAAPAQALTISNTDDDSHTVTIKIGGDSTELVVEPQMAVEAPCASGCTVELESGEQYEMHGGEEVSIEGGVIFVDAVPGGEDDDDDKAAIGDPDQPDNEAQDSAAAPSDAPQPQ